MTLNPISGPECLPELDLDAHFIFIHPLSELLHEGQGRPGADPSCFHAVGAVVKTKICPVVVIHALANITVFSFVWQ